MSCTVSIIPYLLITVISSVVGGVGAVSQINSSEEFELSNTDVTEAYMKGFNNSDFDPNKMVNSIPVEHFIEKDFETVFMDKTLLIKTLEEHGVTNIYEDNGTVKGEVENFTLNFTKSSEEAPYSLHITCKECDNANEKVADLTSEYALNVQEETYLNLISKLKDSNMEIETEEVLDDNTIVLTVNLE